MGIKLVNNAETLLATAIDATATSLVVEDASSFPSLAAGDYFYCTLERMSGSREIVKVTGISGNVFGIERGQEDTAAISFAAGSLIELRLTLQNLEDFLEEKSTARITPADFDTLTEFFAEVENGTPAYVPDGTYTSTTNIGMLTDGSAGKIDVICDPEALFDFSGAPAGNHILIGDHTTGTTELTATYPVLATIDNFAVTITLDDGAGEPDLVEGDLLYIIDESDYSLTGGVSLGGSETYYRQGCVVPVVSVSGGVVTLQRRVRGGPYDHTNPDLKIYKTNRRIVNWRGGTIKCADGQANGLSVYDATDSYIQVSVLNSGFSSLALGRPYNVVVDRPDFRSQQTGSTSHYGLWAVGAFGVIVNDADMNMERHCVTFTAGSRPGYVVNRNCGTNGGSFVSRAAGSLDQHGPCEGCFWNNPYAEGHVTLGGNHGTLMGGEIHSSLAGASNGKCVTLRDPWGSNFTVGGGVHLHSDDALGGGSAILEMTGLGMVQGGKTVLGDIVFHQNVANSGTRDCALVTLTAGSDLEVSLVARNWTRVVADGITDNTSRFSITGTATSSFKSVDISELDDVYVLATDVRGPIHRISDVSATGTGQGLDYRLATNASVQELYLDNVVTTGCTQGGIRVGGASSADPTYVVVKDCISGENAQSGSAGDQLRGSIQITTCKKAVIQGGEYGDLQDVQTQTLRISASDVGTLTIAPDVRHRGTVPLPDSFSSVTSLRGRGKELLAQDFVKVSTTGTTAETRHASVFIPKGAIGKNGSLEVELYGSWTNDASTKTPRIRLGGHATVITETVVASSSSGLLFTGAADIQTGTPVEFSNSGGALPTGISASTQYYAIRVSATTYKVATSLANSAAGTAIAYTDAGSGTHTAIYGATILAAAVSTTGHGCFARTVGNRNSASSQVISFSTAITNSFSVGSGSASTMTVDTTKDQYVTFTGQLADSSDTISLEGYRVWITYGT